MHTLLQDFLACFSRAATFSNVENLGDARRLMHKMHLEELEQRQHQKAKQRATQQSSRGNAALHDINHKPVHTSIF